MKPVMIAIGAVALPMLAACGGATTGETVEGPVPLADIQQSWENVLTNISVNADGFETGQSAARTPTTLETRTGIASLYGLVGVNDTAKSQIVAGSLAVQADFENATISASAQDFGVVSNATDFVNGNTSELEFSKTYQGTLTQLGESPLVYGVSTLDPGVRTVTTAGFVLRGELDYSDQDDELRLFQITLFNAELNTLDENDKLMLISKGDAYYVTPENGGTRLDGDEFPGSFSFAFAVEQ